MSEGCKYCRSSCVIVENNDVTVLVRFGCLWIERKISYEKGSGKSDGSGQGIAFCPMCGRKLHEADEKE